MMWETKEVFRVPETHQTVYPNFIRDDVLGDAPMSPVQPSSMATRSAKIKPPQRRAKPDRG
jgi:hypothetical protein